MPFIQSLENRVGGGVLMLAVSVSNATNAQTHFSPSIKDTNAVADACKMGFYVFVTLPSISFLLRE